MPVLIETLWNVKLLIGVGNILSIGINRNIVECKVARKIMLIVCVPVLIETLWNVK